MAIVCPTEPDVEGYVAAGREVKLPRPDCPECRRPMQLWGWYERDVRVSAEVIHRLEVRRVRCFERTHALLSGFVTWGRLDAVEVIGQAVEMMCGGAGMRRVAEDLGLKHTTVRDWRLRFARRAEMLAIGFCRYCVAVGDLAPRLFGHPEASGPAITAARPGDASEMGSAPCGGAMLWSAGICCHPTWSGPGAA